MGGRCPPSLLSPQSPHHGGVCVQVGGVSKWQIQDLHGPPILWPKAHGSVREVLSALTHEPYDFAPLDSNLKGASDNKGGHFYIRQNPP